MSSHALDFVEQIDIHLIRKSHLLMLRSNTDSIDSLMDSIRQKGLLQPILVRRTDDCFEIVAGHRRFEACKRLRWKKVPACVSELSDKEAFEVALTENIQRRSLNPMEEAEAFDRYVKEYGWGGTSELAAKIGKSQEYVSQKIFLLDLPEPVKKKIITRQLSPSAARELVWLKDSEEQRKLAEMIVENKIPTRAVRYMVRAARFGREGSRVEKLRILETDFERHGKNSEYTNPEFKTLEKVILSLRICMLRLDSILGGMDQKSDSLKDFVMEQRRHVHGLIDNAVKFKIEQRQKVVTE